MTKGRDRSGRAPYAPARELLLPVGSLALSLPTVLVGSVWVVAGTYYALVGHSLFAVGSGTMQVPLPVCLVLTFGPMLAAVLCMTQRTRAEERYGSALLLGYRIKRLNTIALRCALLALLMIPLMGVVSVVATTLHPQ